MVKVFVKSNKALIFAPMKQDIATGQTYTFTNKFNYTTTVKVIRVNDKSVFYSPLLCDNSWGAECRMSRKSLEQYSLINQ